MSKYSVFYRDGEICLRVPAGESFCNHVITDATAHRLQNELAEARIRLQLKEVQEMRNGLDELVNESR